jgi:hypothetical protein
VEQGHSAQYPDKPAAEDRAWHSSSNTTVGHPTPSSERPHEAPQAAPLSSTSRNLLESSEREVRQVAEQHGLPWNTGLSNTAHAIAASARGQGMSDINLFRVADGQIRYGQLDGATLKDGGLDARQAARPPISP